MMDAVIFLVGAGPRACPIRQGNHWGLPLQETYRFDKTSRPLRSRLLTRNPGPETRNRVRAYAAADSSIRAIAVASALR